jgi:hypothetical protein
MRPAETVTASTTAFWLRRIGPAAFEAAIERAGQTHLWARGPAGFGGRAYNLRADGRRHARVVFDHGIAPYAVFGSFEIKLTDLAGEAPFVWRARVKSQRGTEPVDLELLQKLLEVLRLTDKPRNEHG